MAVRSALTFMVFVLLTRGISPTFLRFLEDLASELNSKTPVVVFGDETDSHLGYCKDSTSFDCLFLHSDDAVGDALSHIRALRMNDMFDLIAFSSSTRNKFPLRNLSADSADFFSAKIPVVVDEALKSEFHLRLDRNVLFYRRPEANGIFQVHEAYAIKGVPIPPHPIGYWTPKRGFIVTCQYMDILERRRDFGGIELKNAILDYSVITLLELDSKKRLVGMQGMFPDFLLFLQERLNFTSSLSLPADGKWSGFDKNGSWTGLVGLLASEQVDLVTAGLTQNLERSGAIDFTVPLYPEKITLIGPSRVTTPQVHVWVYRDILSVASWAILCVVGVTLAVGFVVQTWYKMESFHGTAEPERFGLTNALALVVLMTWKLNYEDLRVRRLSAKILYLTSSLAGLLLMSHYASDLTSRITVGPTPVPIKSLGDALRQGYEIAIRGGTSLQDSLSRAPKGSPAYRAYAQSLASGIVFDSNEGAKEYMVGHQKTLWFGIDLYTAFDERTRSLQITDGYTTPLGFGLQKDSEFKEVFNFHLQQMDESGVKQQIVRKWRYVANRQFGMKDPPTLGFDVVLFPFVTVALGAAAAILVLALESAAHTWHSFVAQYYYVVWAGN